MELDETSHKVLVCHADSENSLGVIRSLGQRGIKVVAASHSFFAKGKWSKYVVKRLKEPSSDDPENYVKWLIRIAKEEHIDIFLPTSDLLVWIASNWRDDLSDYIRVPLAPKEVVDIALRKDLTYNVCEKYGIAYPKTYYPTSYDEVIHIANEIEYPVVVKPRTRVGVIIEGKGFIANSKEELLEKYQINKFKSFMEPHLQRDPLLHWPLIQEFVEGPMQNLYTIGTIFDKKSRPIAISCGRKIRQWPIKMGNCTMAETNYNKDAVKTSINILKKIKWRGIVEVEIKQDVKDGKFKIIELNPRTYTWTWLAVQTGVDLPYLGYNFAFDNVNNEKLKVSKEELAYIYWLTDFFGLPSQLSYAKDKREFIRTYLKSLRRKKVCAVCNREDPLPFFADLIDNLRLIPKYLKRLNQ